MLRENGVIGGINYNWFTADGVQFSDYFLTVSVEDLKAICRAENRYVVLIAGGMHKVDPIKVAVSTKMINILVTDSRTVGQLLS
jgi:DNA-binding transcriptional regulator LsrR (DeoR family)